MARILHIAAARPGGLAHWAGVALAALAAALGGIWAAGSWQAAPAQPRPRAVAAPPAMPLPANEAARAALPAALPAAPSTTACPMQVLHLAIGGQPPQPICVDGTRVSQSGNLRSYSVQAGGVEGWRLQVDLAAGALMKVILVDRSGSRHACDAADCAGGVALESSLAGSLRAIGLQALRLPAEAPAGAGAVVLDGRLELPADEQVPGLACEGPALTIGGTDGSARKFCGQGGAGFDLADDGTRHYRFQDHESRTLTVSVGPEQRILGITLGRLGCRAAACSGASTSGGAPDNPGAERSFFFGRTPLFDGSAARPAMVIDGTLVMPAQE